MWRWQNLWAQIYKNVHVDFPIQFFFFFFSYHVTLEGLPKDWANEVIKQRLLFVGGEAN